MTAVPKKPAAKEPEPNPDVCRGDHVYFRHPKGPHAAEVLATGRHGITVRHEGQAHRVKWEHVLGHKTRKSQKYNVLDEGEDGLIVEDEHGQRRYITVPPEARGEKMVLSKAFGAGTGRMIIFAKSGEIKGKAGLSLKDVTDKTGKTTKHWVRSQKDLPSAGERGQQHEQAPASRVKAGDQVAFKNGEHEGQGKVHSVGEHGAVIHDAAGGEHRVLHEHIAQPKKLDADASGALFPPEEVAALPDKVNQPVSSWEELQAKGTEGLAQYKEILGKVGETLGLKTGLKPDGLSDEQWSNDEGFLFIGSLKGAERAKQKVEADYGGDWSQLRDMVRATISMPSMDGVKDVVTKLKEAGLELAQKPKDRFAKPTPEGYRDLMAIVKLPNGMLAELQIHLKSMTLAKNKGHKDYETTRTLQGKYSENEPSDKWSDADHRAFYEALKSQKDIYNSAWDGSDKSAEGSEEKLTKSEQSRTMILLMKRTAK
jgi:hypothetical protein